MGSSFEPGNPKNTRVNTLLHARDLQEEPGRWQNFTYKIPAQLLALLAILSVQMGAAVGEGLFSAIGPLGTTFLPYAWVLQRSCSCFSGDHRCAG